MFCLVFLQVKLPCLLCQQDEEKRRRTPANCGSQSVLLGVGGANLNQIHIGAPFISVMHAIKEDVRMHLCQARRNVEKCGEMWRKSFFFMGATCVVPI